MLSKEYANRIEKSGNNYTIYYAKKEKIWNFSPHTNETPITVFTRMGCRHLLARFGLSGLDLYEFGRRMVQISWP